MHWVWYWWVYCRRWCLGLRTKARHSDTWRKSRLRMNEKLVGSLKNVTDCRPNSLRSNTPVKLNFPGGFLNLQCEQKKIPPLKFSDIFPKRLGIFSPNFTRLLYVFIYAGLQIFIQLSATLTKLCHIKRDHHNVLKMSTIDRNVRWVVALNMA